MKIALAGVGPWGRLLVRKFQSGGAEVVAYARSGGPDEPGLGRRVAIDELFDQADVAALIVAAPPDVTQRLATRAAASGLPVLATKPLQLAASVAIRAPFFVDYVRLWSPFYAQLKARVSGHAVRQISVTCCGPGPFRAFSSLDDYGPHALAFVHDLLGEHTVMSAVRAESQVTGDGPGTMHRASAVAGQTALAIEVGNGAAEKCVRLRVDVEGVGTLTYEEDGPSASLTLDGMVLDAGPHDPLALMAAEFMADARSGRADPRFVALTVAVTRSLRLIHAAEQSTSPG